MSIFDKYSRLFHYILPMPFTIAIILTAITALLALFLTIPSDATYLGYIPEIAVFWHKGFWELLSFTMQMMLILVLGHILALTHPVKRSIDFLTTFCSTTRRAVFFVTLFTLIVSFINWGLCLIFGAIFARKVAENAQAKGWQINFPAVAASGYAGMMAWHGGLSGSAPVIMSDAGHFLVEETGVISLQATVFSWMNMFTEGALLALLPASMVLMVKNIRPTPISLTAPAQNAMQKEATEGAEKLDTSVTLGTLTGLIFISVGLYVALIKPDEISFSFLDLNFINFMLFGLGLLLHGSFRQFLDAAKEAIQGSVGIMLQFPLYAGIMGIMKYAGLVQIFSNSIVSMADAGSLPLFTFLSAAVVNVFVPSGGGQWAVQGPIFVDACQQLNVPVAKVVMALAYGDQLTNMMQPFWALPLLGITGLKAKEILPYTLFLMMLGILIYTAVLLVF